MPTTNEVTVKPDKPKPTRSETVVFATPAVPAPAATPPATGVPTTDASSADGGRAQRPVPKWALPAGFILYAAAFGITLRGLAPGDDFGVPADAHFFAGVIGLIILWKVAHLDKFAVGAMTVLLVVSSVLGFMTGGDPQEMKDQERTVSADGARLEATVAYIREEPNAESENDFKLTTNQHPPVEVFGESEHEPGWFRVRIGSNEGWMFGSLVSGIEGFDYATGETRTGQTAQLVDANGDDTGQRNPTAHLVLITGLAGGIDEPLYQVLLPDGAEAFVRQGDINRL